MSGESGPTIIIREEEKAGKGVETGSGLLLTERYTILVAGLPSAARACLTVVIIGLAAAYVVSPVDVLPEALMGPFGSPDDVTVLAIATSLALYTVTKRRIFIQPLQFLEAVLRAHLSHQGDS